MSGSDFHAQGSDVKEERIMFRFVTEIRDNYISNDEILDIELVAWGIGLILLNSKMLARKLDLRFIKELSREN